MAWEHFDTTKRGTTKVLNLSTGEISDCQYERGVVSTGRSRTFWGCQIIISINDEKIIGRSKGYTESYYAALEDCNRKMKHLNMLLLVSGNSPAYYETPLRGGSGYGYITGNAGHVDILDFYIDEKSKSVASNP